MLTEEKLSRFPQNGYLNNKNNSTIVENYNNQTKNNVYEFNTNDNNIIDEITESLQRSLSFKCDNLEQNDIYDEQNIHQLFKSLSFNEYIVHDNSNNKSEIKKNKLISDKSSTNNNSLRKIINIDTTKQTNKIQSSNKILNIKIFRNLETDIEGILYGIFKSTSIDEIKEIWNQQKNIITPIIQRISSFNPEIIQKIHNRNMFKLKTTSLSTQSIRMNNLLNKNFKNNENKWAQIKLFIINEILKNNDLYGPLVFRGAIGIKDK